ncbi:methionyl-tRNA formyltransferase [Psychrobacter sp. Arc29]|uniref:formyltransferase family protein n=1 Tax=Psychrobacter sp. Arc29 TaxID=3046690 RepID=UPI00352D92D8
MNYIVAAVGDWNRKMFDELTRNLAGNWHYVSTPAELNKKIQGGFSPRYIFFPHWRWIVPINIVTNYECICFHMTDVPYGRGGSPLQNLIVRGHKYTVVTALRMEEGLDTGPVYLKEPLSVAGRAEDIYQRASELSWQMMANIIVNQIEPVSQEGKAVVFSRRTPKQSEIPQNLTLDQVYDYIRMLDAPDYPKAFLREGSYQLEFDNAKRIDDEIIATVKIKLKDI